MHFLLYLCSRKKTHITMSTLEFNALKGELARDMLNIEDIEVLQKVQRYLRRIIKAEQTQNNKAEMTREEFCAKVEQSSAQKAMGKTITMQPNESSQDFINRLLCM